ncbi:hypothetical protein LSH36_928g00004 [Paralvinella palmiformis]|uniref:Aromatic-L-amino-acid decarboxylase n=1 Tax=Paralvinella palmiformis TaxID=53620 RepID=A0AAD9IY43_9ANNE|nr:hypothetical protein LSH36_928g00004 [Paralvinella palmiformis]
MDAEEFRRRGKEMIDYVADYLEKDIRKYPPLAKVEPGYLKKLIPEEAPGEPESYDDLMKDVSNVIMPGAASPACTELEVIMMDWLAKMLKLPDKFISGGKGGGVIQGTASEATFVALLAARNKMLAFLKENHKTGEDKELIGKLVAYCSDQAHSSVERACLLGAVRCHQVVSDDVDEMRGEALEAAMKEDKENGLIPFFVVATLGTTPCCSYDQLLEIGPVCQAEEIWLHIDAAYAGSAFICPEFRPYLDGIEFADSFNFNPHKWLLVNFDCSAMWFKDSGHVVNAFNVDPLYLRHEHEGKVPDYRHWHIPLGRRFRSLKLWFVMRLYGIKGLQQHIRKHVSLAKQFEEMLKSDARFVITHKVTLGLVCFRLKDKSNDINAELLKRINADGRIHMVPSNSKGVYFLRFALCSSRTELPDIEFAWSVITELATNLLDENKNYE